MNTVTSSLPHRSCVRIGGPDRVVFLQGLVSNDVMKATDKKTVYAALLTPQGKFLHDLFIFAQDDFFVIDVETARADDFLRRLAAYKLRAKVTFENLGDALTVWAAWGDMVSHTQSFSHTQSSSHTQSFTDPRLDALGQRIYLPKNSTPDFASIFDGADYDRHRRALGVADGSRDLEIEKSTLAEGNFDYLNGIDWKKGCYVGQELTARMHYRGLAKKRLFPVQITGDVATGMPITLNDSEVGTLRSHSGGYGLALLAIEAAQNAAISQSPLSCGTATMMPHKPAWMIPTTG